MDLDKGLDSGDFGRALDAAADRAERLEREPLALARIERRVSDALAIQEEDARAAGTLGYMPSVLVQVTMPHSKQVSNEFERRNGKLTLHIMAPAKVGLPYGHYPRLLLAWVTTAAVKERTTQLELGDSLSGFMRELGLTATGGRWGSIPRLHEHMRRFFCSTFSLSAEASDGEFGMGMRPVEAYRLWWDPKSPDQGDLWKSTITLNQSFYEGIIRRPVPLDMRVLKALARERSPLAIDIYSWLTWRMFDLRRDTAIPWELLQLQFGGDYSAQNLHKFKARFSQWLRLVLLHYSGAKVEPARDGLLLRPSPTHIPLA